MSKATLTIAFAVALLSITPLNAQQAAPTDKGASAQQTAPNVTEFDKQAAQVQEYMQKMQGQMDKLRQTQDPQERQKLLEEHWTTMQSSMGMMQGMMGPGMMGPGMMAPGMKGGAAGGPMMGGHMMMGWHDVGSYYSKLTPEQMKQRQYMMGRYMGMQQMMMNQMMQHQNSMWMQQPPR